jgi:hypothetical protein
MVFRPVALARTVDRDDALRRLENPVLGIASARVAVSEAPPVFRLVSGWLLRRTNKNGILPIY